MYQSKGDDRMQKTLSDNAIRALLVSQRDEMTGAAIYAYMAKREKNEHNKELLSRMAREEQEHMKVWQRYTGREVKADRFKICWFCLVSVLLGYTFVLKLIQKDEENAIARYGKILEELPEAVAIQTEEQRHEDDLIGMLDEERLQYIGSMVLGLNDALVELTGTLAGLTFALMNTRLIALSGIITGAAATLSMAASNYLAQRADNNPKALTSSAFTGIAYLVTVMLLVLPYLLLPISKYVLALGLMIAVVVLVILMFNYYIAVAKSEPFFKRFAEMAFISLTVAVIAFLIGLLAKSLLGVDIG